MKYKPDWPEARKRLTALWHGEMLDRPCISVQAHRPAPESVTVPEPANEEARWLDPEYVLPAVLHHVQNTWWGGESIPSSLIMARWVVCLGGTPVFRPDTIWFETHEVDFSKPTPFRHDPESPWLEKYRKLIIALGDAAGRDDFMVGSCGGLPANDLLSMMMGTTEFLTALMDHPEWMEKAILKGAEDQQKAKQELQALVRSRGHAFWYGNAGWMPFWAPEQYYSTQSDVSCMLSPAAFERFVMPEIELYGSLYNAVWYHLDGADALQHLPRLLSLPYLRVLQYTPAPGEPPNGPGHLDFYREVQKAGKILHIALPKENVEKIVRSLNPALLMLSTGCESPEEGEQLLEDSVKWAAMPHMS